MVEPFSSGDSTVKAGLTLSGKVRLTPICKRANVDHKQNYTTHSVDNDSIFSKVTRKLLKEIEQIPFQIVTGKTHLKELS